MAVGEDTLPELAPVAGVRLGVASAGIKSPDKPDLVVLELCAAATVAAVFTRNAFCAAPVTVARSHLTQSQPRLLLINTGNANAGTGEQGIADALDCCRCLAEIVKLKPEQVLPFSTGVIGEPLPVARIRQAMPAALEHLSSSAWRQRRRVY